MRKGRPRCCERSRDIYRCFKRLWSVCTERKSAEWQCPHPKLRGRINERRCPRTCTVSRGSATWRNSNRVRRSPSLATERVRAPLRIECVTIGKHERKPCHRRRNVACRCVLFETVQELMARGRRIGRPHRANFGGRGLSNFPLEAPRVGCIAGHGHRCSGGRVDHGLRGARR